MEHVKLKYYARPDLASDPEWEQALEVSAKYLAKKLQNKKQGGAFDDSVFGGIPAEEHFAFNAFDKLYTGQCKWSEHRALHTQIIRIALSDISHHVRDWTKNAPPEMVEIDERMADHLADDEDFMDIVYEMAEEAANGDQQLLDYLKEVREVNNYEAIAENMCLTITEVYQLQRKLIRRLQKIK
jgi:hypothetical protein